MLYASVSNDFIWLGLAKSVDPEMVERAAEKISSKVGKLRKKSKKDKNNTKEEHDKKEST